MIKIKRNNENSSKLKDKLPFYFKPTVSIWTIDRWLCCKKRKGITSIYWDEFKKYLYQHFFSLANLKLSSFISNKYFACKLEFD